MDIKIAIISKDLIKVRNNSFMILCCLKRFLYVFNYKCEGKGTSVNRNYYLELYGILLKY